MFFINKLTFYQESDYVSRNQVYAYNPIINESGDTSLEVYLLNSNLKDFTFPESFWGVPVTRIAEGACNNKFTGSAIHVLKHAASFRILHYQTVCNILETTHSMTHSIYCKGDREAGILQERNPGIWWIPVADC